MKTKLSPQKHFAYIEYSFSYLQASHELLKNYQCNGINTFLCVFKPAIFCLRHSLELFLKFLSISFDIDFEKNHNINKLIKKASYFLVRINKDQIKSAASRFGIKEKMMSGFIKGSVYILNDITDRYYLHHYLGGKNFEDSENILLRYPENMDFVNKISIIKKDDLNTIKKDIENLRMIIYSFIFSFSEKDILSR